MSKLFLLEDDLSLVDGLSYSLNKQGYEITVSRTVTDAMAYLRTQSFDLLILDVSLPDGTGFEVCREVRKTSQVPIIFLTASDEEVNVIMGLDIGGDDYIIKPFRLGELLSRVNALLRRSKGFSSAEAELSSGGITVQLLKGKVLRGREPLDLTAGEHRLLCLFMQNPDIVLSKETILSRLWDENGSFVDDNTLAVYIRRLRTKIEDDPGNPSLLVTVRGVGYKWNPANGGDNT